jgi:hypothetical protein
MRPYDMAAKESLEAMLAAEKRKNALMSSLVGDHKAGRLTAAQFYTRFEEISAEHEIALGHLRDAEQHRHKA